MCSMPKGHYPRRPYEQRDATLSGPKDRALGPPAEVLAERDRRYALAARHPDPNRAVLGDPLPGRSALDRRRRGG